MSVLRSISGEETISEPAPQVVGAQKKDLMSHKKAMKWEGYAREVWASREDYRTKYEALQNELVVQKLFADSGEEVNKIKIRNNELESINKRLLIERSARIRAPRAIKLAEKSYEIGELGNAENIDHKKLMIKAKVKELMELSEDSFLNKEKTIENIYSKMETRQAQRVEESENSLLMPFLPHKPASQSELISWEGMSRAGSSKDGDAFYDWSRSPTRGRW